MYALNETIRPSADIRNHYSEVSRRCRENREAVVITVNGRGDTVSLGHEEYNRLKARMYLLETLSESEEDVQNGRVAPMKQTFDEIEAQIMLLATEPEMGVVPKYDVLRRQGYRVLILKKDMVFYKVDHQRRIVTVYAVVDARQDYLDILAGL